MRRCNVRNNCGSAGISSMIVFIALILVSATLAVILIRFGQELFDDSGQDGQDTENTIYGKIVISNAVITAIEFDENDNDADGDNEEPVQSTLQITFELSPGAPEIDDHEVKWAVLCENEIQPEGLRWSNEGNLESVTTATGDGGDVDAVRVMEFGITYMITIPLHHTTDTNNDGILDEGGCPPNFLETHTLIFVMGNSGSYTSWELRYDESLATGEVLI
ncbi:MAG: hypothetical protein CMB56_002010 [Methanobacteriota archaeon]|nr:MAG: hypothetical protein CMB56_002010 [Euryarchaeota archaeon]|tara:strand:+ start:7990 stop:8649 length:660 start_codon:yes stop_codon:yes gene_type:complete